MQGEAPVSLFEDMAVLVDVLRLLYNCLNAAPMRNDDHYQCALLYEMTAAMADDACAPS